MRIGQHGRTIPIGDQVFVIGWQQAGTRCDLSVTAGVMHQILLTAETFAPQLAAKRLDGPARFGHRESRPPAEIRKPGRGMTAEIAARQDSCCLIPVQRSGGGNPFRPKGIGGCSGAVPPAAHHAISFGMHQQTFQIRHVDRHSHPLQSIDELRTGQMIIIAQGMFHLSETTDIIGKIDAMSACERRIGRPDTPRRQPHHPYGILRRNEMPCGTHHMQPQKTSVTQSIIHTTPCRTPQPQADGPFRHRIILRLHHAHPPHQIDRIVEPRCGKLLGPQANIGQMQHKVRRAYRSTENRYMQWLR